MALINSRQAVTLLSIASTLLAGAALADTTPTTAAMPSVPSATSVSTINRTSSLSKILKNVHMLYFGEYAGPAISDPLNSKGSNNEYGKRDYKQYIDNSLITSYKLNDNGLEARIGINGKYTLVTGDMFTLEDPYVALRDSKLIHVGNFSYSADIREYLPVTKGAHNNTRYSRLRSIQIATYQFPNSKWSLTSFQDLNYYVLGSNVAADGSRAQNFYALINPGVSYQAAKNLGLSLSYELDTSHYLDDKVFGFNNEQTWAYLSASWDVTKKFNFSPFLQARPGGKISADTLTLWAYLSYKIM